MNQSRSQKTPPEYRYRQTTLELEKRPPDVPMASNVRSKCLRLITELISSVAFNRTHQKDGRNER
jgi:hypothetical protein